MTLPDPTRDPAVLAELLTRWYSLKQLADRWGLSPKTVRHWLQDARHAGHGPSPDQAMLLRSGRAGTQRLILRADYALSLHTFTRGQRLDKHRRALSSARSPETAQGRYRKPWR